MDILNSLGLGSMDEIIKMLKIDKLVLMLPEALLALWRMINAFILRGIWIGMAKELLAPITFLFAQEFVNYTLKLATLIVLVLMIMVKPMEKWRNTIILTMVLKCGIAWAFYSIQYLFMGAELVTTALGLGLIISSMGELKVHQAISGDGKGDKK